ncbi:MAG TPA: alpha/beta hydrolase [Acidimicrobiales bacterium]|nr:alpha/beta hydrolase [Acidimicrobiales bacterium]
MALQVHTAATVETRVGEIRLSKAGQAETALLVITPMAEWMVAALPAELCDLFTVNLVELPGGGSAVSPAGASTIDAVVDAVHDVVERIGEKPVLFGHSMNGCLAFAAASTEACSGVIAVTPPSSLPPDQAAVAAYWESHAEPDRRRRANEIIKAHEAATSDEDRARLQSESRLRQWYDLEFDPTELDALATLNGNWVSSIFESGKAVDWQSLFRRLQQPVLLAFGEYDFVAPPGAWTAEVAPPAATLHLFKRSGHTPYVEETEEFLQVVAAWRAANVL